MSDDSKEVAKVYVVVEDTDGNFHQGKLEEVDVAVIGRLVKVYSGGNFEKSFVDKMVGFFKNKGIVR